MSPGAASLGFWIASRDATVWGRPALEYRGLDRRPYLPGPDEDAALRERGRGRLVDLTDELYDGEDSGELHRDEAVALRLSEALTAEGVPVEVILAELIPPAGLSAVPEDLRALFEQHIGRWLIEEPAVSGSSVPLGIDVTYPIPTFHSAIRQPVLSSIAPELIDELNRFGLFPALDIAQQAAERGNREDTSWLPLCPVAISLVTPASGDKAAQAG